MIQGEVGGPAARKRTIHLKKKKKNPLFFFSSFKDIF